MGNSYILKKVRYEFEDWKKDYTGYLENLYKTPEDLYELPENPYNDPDAIAMKNVAFYRDLASFLNKREKKMEKQLNGKWEYRLINGDTTGKYGIHVCDENGELFVLFSDQFGFSAPDLKKNHPYDTYVKLAKETGENRYKEAISNVVEWIFNTRSIGGSFLWPRHGAKGRDNYNYKRGGTEKYSCYIQDRVDLTLLEIKHIYDERPTESDILFQLYSDRKKYKDLKTFFDHFGSFKTYIEFFMMDDLVKGDMPIDIITGETMTDEDIKKYRNKKVSIFDPEIDRLEQMLRRVNDLIVARTKRIESELFG